MTADGPQNQISPDLFIDSLLGYQKTAALRAAIALDLFSIIADSDGTAATLAARTGCAERGIRIFCDYFTVIGFLEKHEGRYRLTPSTATFLTRGSPAYMGSIADFIASPEMLGLWLEDPVSYVRNGGSPGLANVAANNPVWVKFAKAMVPFIAAPAAALAAEIGSWRPAPRRVLDIAAGHGMFGIAIAKAIPGVEITALDWPAVLQVAEENAAAAGLAGRYRLQPGSAFEVDWGSDNDAVLLPNFLHHFDQETCVGLLARARRSLAPGGRIVAVEMVPNDDRVTPPGEARFAFMMLASTPKGDAYTEREYLAMGQAAGLGALRMQRVPQSIEALLVWDRD